MFNKRTFLILLSIILFIIIMFTIVVPSVKEGFTPKIRETYRPLVRSAQSTFSSLMYKYDPAFYGKKTLKHIGIL